MSLNVKTIDVGGRQLTLRLTSKSLMNFALKHGVEGSSPTIAVLSAATDLSARIDLLSNALQHPENKNTIKDGALLLDLMADDPSWDRDAVNRLILELAVQSGLISDGELESLLEAVRTGDAALIATLERLLSGDRKGGEEDPVRSDRSTDSQTPI